MPVMTEEQYSARPTSDLGSVTNNTTNQAVKPTESQTTGAAANPVVKNIESSRTAAVTAVPTSAISNVPKNTTLSLSESIANTRKLQETQEVFLSVDNFDGYYSDNDNIGVTNTLEREKKEYDLNNKQRDIISTKLGKDVSSFCCSCIISALYYHFYITIQ